MNPLEDTISFENEKNQTQEVFSSLTSSNHEHNGIDAQRINFPNLYQANTYIAYSNISLSTAQILALHTTPVTLVPATGLNTTIIVEGITAYIRYNGTAYTGANNLEIRYTDGSGTKVTADIPVAFLNSSADNYSYVPQTSIAITPVIDKPIVAVVPVANPGAGNSSITLIVKYRVVYFK